MNNDLEDCTFFYEKALRDCLNFKQPSPRYSMSSMDGGTTWYTAGSMTQDNINSYMQGWEDYRSMVKEKLEELLKEDMYEGDGQCDMSQRVVIDAVSTGWIVTHQKAHCTLGVQSEKEVFINVHDMMLWVMEHLSSHDPAKKTEELNNDEKQ